MRKIRRLSVAIVAIVAVAGLMACDPPPPSKYVALGDSYTAGPLILPQETNPLGCLRSSNDWPHYAFSHTSLKTLADVSCSGAQTRDMATEQGVTPGPNPPQLDSLDSDTAVVTLQIGGNDIGFSSIVKDCVRINPFDAPCRDTFQANGKDELRTRIMQAGPKVGAVVQQIKQRAPQAKILLVGYPSVLPEYDDNACWPTILLLPTDVNYLRGIEHALNQMIANQAAFYGVTYVDIQKPSIGHDACSGGGRWVEPIIPNTDAAPVHPNKTGMQNFGQVVGNAINAALGA